MYFLRIQNSNIRSYQDPQNKEVLLAILLSSFNARPQNFNKLGNKTNFTYFKFVSLRQNCSESNCLLHSLKPH